MPFSAAGTACVTEGTTTEKLRKSVRKGGGGRGESAKGLGWGVWGFLQGMHQGVRVAWRMEYGQAGVLL